MENSSITFIPFPARVVAILQLCIAFTIILGVMSYPFMGELFETRSSQLLFETVIGVSSGKSDNPSKNAARFIKLPDEQKSFILKHYELLQAKNQVPFFAKLVRSMHILLMEISPWKLVWLLLSLVLPILLLLRIEGAAQAIWLLPLLTLVYAVDNRMYGTGVGLTHEARLFPTEQIIVNEYLKKPLEGSIEDQKEQLRKGWNQYLVHEWFQKNQPQTLQDFVLFTDKVEEGEFAFDVARLEAHIQDRNEAISPFRKQESIFMLCVYLAWNFFLAILVRKKMNVAFVTETRRP